MQRNFEFCLFVDVSFSFTGRSNHRVRAAHRVLKAVNVVLRESKKNRHGSRAVRSTIEVGPLSVIVRVLRGRVRLGKGQK